jgi:secreted trypsin-like serine protease
MQKRFKGLALPALLISGILAATGTQANELSPRIVGGFQTDISNAPATVALLSRNRVETDGDLFNAQFCGGTVIATRWILTAAHCLVDQDNNPFSPNSVMVLMGSTDLENPVNQPVGVTNLIVHEDYISTSDGQDIALLQLESDALVTPIALDRQDVTLNDGAFIAGWGAVNDGSDGSPQQFPSELRGAFVRMVPGSDCGDFFPDYRGFTDSTNICAGVPEGGIDSCQGDSGGPMYRITGDSLPVTAVAGITSWGIGCANAENPGVYTNVAAYIDWIEARVGSVTTPPVPPVDDPVNPPVDDPVNPPVDDPVNPPVNDPPVAALTDDDDDFLGSSGGFVLSLLALAVLVRRFGTANAGSALQSGPSVKKKSSDQGKKYLHRTLATALLCTLVGVQPLQASDDNNSQVLSLLDLPIGEQRETVMADAQTLYASEPTCTTVRTGFGMTRRAYFLETCTVANTAGHTLYDSVPSLIEYRFLESELVQVAYEFDEIVDPDKFRACIKEQNKELSAATDAKQAVEADDQFRTTVSNIETVGQIHLMRNN